MTEKGQTLLELVIALGLIVVIITAITLTNIGGLRGSQFSQHQSIATKLAQEAVDITRSIRDNSGTVCGPAANTTNNFNGLWTISACPAPSGCTYVLKTASGSCSGSPTSQYWLSSSSNPETLFQNNLSFKRQITIFDNVASQKELKVTVSWVDETGTHQSNLSTFLTEQGI